MLSSANHFMQVGCNIIGCMYFYLCVYIRLKPSKYLLGCMYDHWMYRKIGLKPSKAHLITG